VELMLQAAADRGLAPPDSEEEGASEGYPGSGGAGGGAPSAGEATDGEEDVGSSSGSDAEEAEAWAQEDRSGASSGSGAGCGSGRGTDGLPEQRQQEHLQRQEGDGGVGVGPGLLPSVLSERSEPWLGGPGPAAGAYAGARGVYIPLEVLEEFLEAAFEGMSGVVRSIMDEQEVEEALGAAAAGLPGDGWL
jgi:hypothetical protein